MNGDWAGSSFLSEALSREDLHRRYSWIYSQRPFRVLPSPITSSVQRKKTVPSPVEIHVPTNGTSRVYAIELYNVQPDLCLEAQSEGQLVHLGRIKV